MISTPLLKIMISTMLKDTYSTEIKNNDTNCCSAPKDCALLFVILSGKLDAEAVAKES